MQALMNPRSVGVIGASERSSRSARALRNLTTIAFQGAIYPINPKYDEVLSLRCYPSVAAIPQPPDLVILAIPASQVPDVLREAHQAGAKAALVLAAGFGEAGEEGRQRHQALVDLAEQGMLICGPNCYGVLNLHARSGHWGGELPNPFLPGNVALVSQSGGTCGLITNPLAEQRKVGFSYVVSCGNQAGVAVEDYLEYLVEDANTDVIAAFVEGFRQPGRLPAIAAKAAQRRKPVVVLKVGRSPEARNNALTHTGSLAGDADIMDALLRQHGFVQVNSLDDLNETIALLALAKDKLAGRRLGVFSGSGGEVGRVSDAALDAGLRFPPLSARAVEAIHAVLPDFASPQNPLDGTGAVYDYPEAFPRVAEILLQEDLDVLAFNINALPPHGSGRTPHRAFARAIADTVERNGADRLVIAYGSLTLGDLDTETIEALRGAGVPYLESPEKALRAVAATARWQEWLNLPLPLQERSDSAGWHRERAGEREISSHGVLPFLEARQLLEDFGIQAVPTRLCRSAGEAVEAAQELGYPVALKIESPDLLHKADAGGVRLGCADANAVRRAYEAILDALRGARVDGVLVQPMAGDGVEMILGIKHDPLVGPAVMIGLGGIFAEVLKDVSLRIPPFGEAEAHAMIEELRGKALLRGVRGRPPADEQELVKAIVRAADLGLAVGDQLLALDINPLLVLPVGQGVLALDALVQLR